MEGCLIRGGGVNLGDEVVMVEFINGCLIRGMRLFN